MTMIEFVENTVIPAINEEKALGYKHTAVGVVNWSWHPVLMAKAIESRTNYTTEVLGRTVYIKFI